MIIFIRDKKYEFNDEELEYMYEAEGNESIVYRYKDKVLKIYKKYCRKDRLNEEDVNRLSSILTNRILLSTDPIYDEDKNFFGYVMNYIRSYSSNFISNLPMKKFLNELDLIHDDLSLLSNNHIDMDDFIMDNLLFNGDIYIIDPGSYVFRNQLSVETVYKENIEKLNFFIINQLMTCNIPITKKNKEKFMNYFLNCDQFVGEIMKREINSNDTVKSYVKRIVK